MTTVTCHITMSIDGYVAGPDQSVENPLGVNGENLHQWMFHTATFSGKDVERTVDDDNVEAILAGNGAYIMGRNMFGPIRGDWDEQWNGWWGDNPPYQAPVFVLTHHAREPEKMEGGTTFNFVTDGIESALAQARAAAGEKNVAIAGGASTVQQYLKAGLLDELNIHISPLVLGQGERLLDDIGDTTLEQVKVTFSNHATHITYRVIH